MLAKRARTGVKVKAPSELRLEVDGPRQDTRDCKGPGGPEADYLPRGLPRDRLTDRVSVSGLELVRSILRRTPEFKIFLKGSPHGS